MESTDNTGESGGQKQDGGGVQDLALSLNFVPSWAKQASTENPYADHSGGGDRRGDGPRGDSRGGGFRREGGGGNDRGPRRDGPPRGGGAGGGFRSGAGDRGPRRDDRRSGPGAPAGGGDRGPRKFDGPPGAPRAPGGAPRPSGGDRGPRRDAPPRGGGGFRRDNDRGPAREFIERLPINVTFVPEKTFLAAVVKDIHDKRRAYPIAMLAGLFLQKPANHLVKFEVQGGKDRPSPLKLWQNAKTGMVFLKRETANSYAVAHDLEEFFEKAEVPVEPPAGNFVCVGRCSLSGELLGPPNFHGYNEKLMELYRTRFSGMPLDVYRSRIEVVRDPAVVEKWKEQQKTVCRFREKNGTETEAKLKRSEAEFLFIEKYAKNLFKEGGRFLMPGLRAAELPDRELRFLLSEAWTRESRFPLTLLFALRAAFKHMKLQTFKVGREIFASAIEPKPIATEHLAENIQKMFAVLKEKPGCNRKVLVEHFLPGTEVESDAGKELLSPLRWLIDKGHVIEFFNGTLSLPSEQMAQTVQQPRAKKTAPAAAAATDTTTETPAAEPQPAADESSSAPTMDEVPVTPAMEEAVAAEAHHQLDELAAAPAERAATETVVAEAPAEPTPESTAP